MTSSEEPLLSVAPGPTKTLGGPEDHEASIFYPLSTGGGLSTPPCFGLRGPSATVSTEGGAFVDGFSAAAVFMVTSTKRIATQIR